ncbi:hypothetical protein AVEN_152206-1 [Araneus ventricosus]|uniref:Uncharacterized protein n=1 Tax=Araneus ventricosus TaxID=182803 RepID=A0A4Y2HKW6_ARAVE|nr:hypothetical protein AVEN_152206-1 [Araneus ventricosus]
MGRHARPTRGGILLSRRSGKQTERRQLLMENSLAYPRGKEKQKQKVEGRLNLKESQTLGYLGVVNPVTLKEDVPLRGRKGARKIPYLVGKTRPDPSNFYSRICIRTALAKSDTTTHLKLPRWE